MTNLNKNNLGLTLVEILIGLIITTIIMGAIYTTYSVVNNSYSKVSDKAKISRSSRDLITMLMRDVRMSGYKYYVGSQEIADYASLTSSGDDSCEGGFILPNVSYLSYNDGSADITNSHSALVIWKKKINYPNFDNSEDNCCDMVQVVYEDFDHLDKVQPFKKFKITYHAKKKNNDDDYYGIYKKVEKWKQERTQCDKGLPSTVNARGEIVPGFLESGDWVDYSPEQLVRDHIIDMEFIPFDSKGKIISPPPIPTLDNREQMNDIRSVDILITFRSKDEYFRFSKGQQVLGISNERSNSPVSEDDRYLRDTVFVTVHTRNIGQTAY